MRQPSPSVRALYIVVTKNVSKNVMCARPRCNALPSDALWSKDHTSPFTLHSSYPTLHINFALHLSSSHLSSSHLISPRLSSSHLFSSHLISLLLRCRLSSSQLLSFHRSTAQPFSSHRSSAWLISDLLYIRKLLLSDRSSSTQTPYTVYLAKKRLYTQKLLQI